jgi:hypothetical protein
MYFASYVLGDYSIFLALVFDLIQKTAEVRSENSEMNNNSFCLKDNA